MKIMITCRKLFQNVVGNVDAKTNCRYHLRRYNVSPSLQNPKYFKIVKPLKTDGSVGERADYSVSTKQ